MRICAERLLRLLWLALGVLPGAARAAPEVAVVGLFAGRAVLVIDGHQQMLKVGDTGPTGVTLIAADSETALLEIEGRRVTLTLGSRQGQRFTAPPEQAVLIAAGAAGMFRTKGGINGQAVDFLVDTGATLVTLDAFTAQRLRLNYANGQVIRINTAGGEIEGVRTRLQRVNIGAIELRDVEATVLTGVRLEQPLLGMSFLNRLDMRNEGGVLRLRQKF